MNVSAWWETGHEMVCSEAYKLLSQKTKQTIEPLLAGQETFGLSCLWADEIKQDLTKKLRTQNVSVAQNMTIVENSDAEFMQLRNQLTHTLEAATQHHYQAKESIA